MTTQHGQVNDGRTRLRGGNGDASTSVAAIDLINVLDGVEVPVVVLRHDSAIAYFNKAAAEVLDLSPSDVGRGSSDISVLAALPNLEKHCSDVIAGGVDSRVNLHLGEKWFVVRISPQTKVDRQVSGTVLTFSDVTAFRANIDQAIYEREFTKAILNTVADPLIVLSADQRIQTGNYAFYTMFGVSRDQTQGLPLWELGNGAPELGPFREQIREMFARDPAFHSVEIDNVFTVKGLRTLILDAHPLSFPGHSERRILVTVRDITERKQVEALRASEHSLRLIVDSIPGLVCIMTGAGEFDLANRQFLEYTGKTLDEMSDWPAIVHPEDLPIVVSRLKGSFETGCPFDTEVRVRRADSTYRWFHCCGLPMRDETGRVIRWYKLLTDIEDRKHAEEALRARERDLSLIIETMPGLVWCADPEGELNYVNQRILEYMGSTPGALAQLGWANFLHPEDVEPTVSAWSNSVATGQPYEIQCRLRRSDGVYRWFHVLGQAARDNQDRVTRWYGLLIDICDRKTAEEALRNSQAQLSRATRTATVGEFAAAIAHEINQPLAAVLTNSEACLNWLSAEPPGLVKAREAAERIVRDSEEAGDVVRRIRSLFKKTPFEKIRLNLNTVIIEVLHILSGETAKRKIGVETDLADALPPILGDRIQLQQLIFNLLSNGIEAMDSTLARPKTLFVRTTLQSAETVLVKIKDCGGGLEDAEKIFEPFFTTKEHGMGMGLAICRSIVDAHHGTLWAESSKGESTTFSFTLPCQPRTAS